MGHFRMIRESPTKKKDKKSKKSKKSIFFDKILYRASFWPSGTWFWSFRSIENGFPIQMVPLWWILELGNDVSWRNNVWHQFFSYSMFLTIWDLVLTASFNRKWFSDSDGTILMEFGARKWCFITKHCLTSVFPI